MFSESSSHKHQRSTFNHCHLTSLPNTLPDSRSATTPILLLIKSMSHAPKRSPSPGPSGADSRPSKKEKRLRPRLVTHPHQAGNIVHATTLRVKKNSGRVSVKRKNALRDSQMQDVDNAYATPDVDTTSDTQDTGPSATPLDSDVSDSKKAPKKRVQTNTTAVCSIYSLQWTGTD